MPGRIRDRLLQHARQHFVGRAGELAMLLEALAEDGPLVTFVYGIGGIGKTSLLNALAEEARSREVLVIALDCRAIQPSAEALLSALSRELGQDVDLSLEAIAGLFEQHRGRVLLAFDTYELFRLMDTWLRQVFIPALPDNIRVFIFGREAPVAAWLTTPGWQGLFRRLWLESLDHQAAAELLLQAGVRPEDVERVNRFANGHPLAIKLAAAAIVERPELKLEEIESRHVVEELAQIYLKDIRDPLTRQLLEASSVVRRVTRSLLSAMLPDLDPQEAYDCLSDLPFIENNPDGLIIHDAIRQSIEALFRAADPSQHHAYRSRAWHQLRRELNSASKPNQWRYMADTIYLIEQPTIRDAFFPSDAHLYAIEQAQPADGPAIRAITRRHDGPEAAAMLDHWWSHLPDSFYVVRAPDTEIVGYYTMFRPHEVRPDIMEADPAVWQWQQHLQQAPIPPDQCVLFVRRNLAAETGEAFSGVQAACWLDVKRAYMAYPKLRRVYMMTQILDIYLPIMAQLGFRWYPEMQQTFDHQLYHTLMLDFGPGFVNGWLAGLVDAQYGPADRVESRLDVEARELMLNGERITLTPLEFGVIRCLSERQDRAVSRVDLLEEVWGYDYDGGGSNVVDAVIRSLRKKLGEQAVAIETVTGVGYRFRGF